MSRWHIEPSGETKMQHQLSFPNVSLRSDAFHFGLEGEFLLVSLPSYKPLWHHDLSFSRLNHLTLRLNFSPSWKIRSGQLRKRIFRA